MNTKRMMGIFAHPDDEGTMAGAILKYKAEGADVGMICATRGEVGEIADPSLATPENLGQVREGELRNALKMLGIPDSQIWFLDYRDSGMVGTADNENPRAFRNADANEVIGKLVKTLREFKPQVVVTFDKTGGYGHPDHITIHHYATEAFKAAGDPTKYPEAGEPFAPSKLYYTAFPRSFFKKIAEWMNTHNPNSMLRSADQDTLGTPDENISVTLNVEQWIPTKTRSWAEHKTQKGTTAPMEAMPEDLRRQWNGNETFELGASRVGPDKPGENDLFAGV